MNYLKYKELILTYLVSFSLIGCTTVVLYKDTQKERESKHEVLEERFTVEKRKLYYILTDEATGQQYLSFNNGLVAIPSPLAKSTN